MSEALFEKLRIIVCCHKKCITPKNKIYVPLQVGTDLSKEKLDMLHDNTDENISAKNKDYSELTGIYWVWKNIEKIYPNIEYIGIAHYRRYLCINKMNFSYKYNLNKYLLKTALKLIIRKPFNFILIMKSLSINVSQLDNKLEKTNIFFEKFYKNTKMAYNSILTTYPIKLIGINVKEGVFFENSKERLNYLIKILNNDWPEYAPYFDATLNSFGYSYANMFIMNKNLFNNYCTFLFDVLFKIEKKFYGKVSSEMRMAGYLGELLTNTFILKNKDSYNIKYMNSFFVN